MTYKANQGTKMKYDLERFIKAKKRPSGGRFRGIAVADHTGRQFSSVSAMLAFWGVVHGTFYARIHRGWSLEDALSNRVGDKK